MQLPERWLIKTAISGPGQDAPSLVQAMRVAIADGDNAALQRAAHTLESTSATLGALELAKLCNEIEVEAHGEHLEDARRWLERIECEYARVCASLPRESAFA